MSSLRADGYSRSPLLVDRSWINPTSRLQNNRQLDRILACALSELDKLRYSRRSLRRYCTIGCHLMAFTCEAATEVSTREMSASRWRESRVHAVGASRPLLLPYSRLQQRMTVS